MKKLLSLIGALSLTASATSVLISCADKDDDKYGDSFIKDNGDLSITTKDLLNWYNDTYGRLGKDPHKTLVEFYNIFAVAIYEEASKEDSIFNDIKADSSEYLNESGEELAQSLKTEYGKDTKAPNTIYGRANNAMISARKVYLDDKKQGTKAWVKYLREQYPWVKNEQTALENAWISNYILTDSTNSAYANFSKALGFGTTDSTWSKGYSSIKINNTEISKLLSEFLTANSDTLTNGKLDEKVTVQANDDKKIASIINLINALGGKNAFGQSTDPFKIEFIENTNDKFLNTLTWKTFLSGISAIFAQDPAKASIGTISEISAANKNIFTITDVQGIKLTDNIYKDFYNYNARPASELDKTQIVSIAPTLNGEKKSQKTNILSNSQRFLVDNYLETKKPVATSEIVLEFSKINANATIDINKEISPAQFVDTSKITNDLIKYFEGFSQFYNLYVLNKDGNSGEDSENTKSNAKTRTTTGLSDFETFYRGANAPNGSNGISSDGRLWKMGTKSSYITPYLTAKKNDKLLTLDYDTTTGTYSNLAKYSVYDFLTTTPEAYTPSTISEWNPENTNIVSGWHNFNQSVEQFSDEAKQGMNELFNLVTDLGRRASKDSEETKEGETKVNKPYKVLNEKDGIIAFIDTDGLHFMKIDGYNLIQSTSSDQNPVSTTQTDDQDKEQSIAYDLLSNTNKELIPYLLNPKLLADEEENNYTTDNETTTPSTPEESINNDIAKSNIINNMGTSFGNDYSKILNYSITNNYERFLVNNTIAKGLLTNNEEKSYLFYNYDILADAKAAVSTTESFGMLGQWMWTYLDEIFNTKGDYEKLFEKFFETDDTVDKKVTAELLNVIENQQQKITEFKNNFELKNNDWIISTERNYKKQMKELENLKIAQTFIPNYALTADMTALDESNIWITALSKNQKVNGFIYNISNAYLNDEIIINNLNKHEGGIK